MNWNRKGLITLLILISTIGVFYLSGVWFATWHHQSIELVKPWSIIEWFIRYKSSPDRFVKLTAVVCTLLPWLVILFASAVIYNIVTKRSLHGAARFASIREIQKAGLLNPKDGYDKTILVGKMKSGEYLCYGGTQFVLLAAPTRSGKGVGVVIPNCLNFSDSLVVLDIKGENFDKAAGFRRACGQAIYKFNPFDEHGQTHCYNPLEYISSDPAQRMGDIDAIATALYSGGNSNDKFWSENAKDLFRGLCLFVLESPDLPKTFGEILRQASGKGKPLKQHITDSIARRQELGMPFSNACIDCLSRIINNADNTLSGIVATFNTPLLIFQNPRVDMATSRNDFDLRMVRKKRQSIFFVVPPNKLKEAAVIVNLFFDQLLNLNTRTLPSQDKTLKYQCLVLMDEMTSIGKVAMIAQAVSYMAGYNMRLLTIIQNKSQLEDVYGKPGAQTIISNHGLMVMYAPSPTVQSDAQEYSEMLGYQTVKSRSHSSGTSSSSTSTSDQRRALMLPQELRELGQENEIISMSECKPIYCKKIRYYTDDAFTNRADMPPPSIPRLDVATFIANLEKRVREANQAELSDPQMTANRLPGADLIPVVDENTNMTEEEIAAFVSQTTNTVMANFVTLKQSDETTDNHVNDMFNTLAAITNDDPMDDDDTDDFTAELPSAGMKNFSVLYKTLDKRKTQDIIHQKRSENT